MERKNVLWFMGISLESAWKHAGLSENLRGTMKGFAMAAGGSEIAIQTIVGKIGCEGSDGDFDKVLRG